MAYPLLLLSALLVPPQGTELRPLNDDERQAMAAIAQEDVERIVSYLASDEFGGRGRGSAGFTTASRYIAERFAKAGLEGLGPDGSFFLYATEETVPTEGTTFRVRDGEDQGLLKLLSASRQPFSFRGAVLEVTPDEEGAPAWPKDRIAGPVLIDQPPPSNRRMPPPYPTLLALRDTVRRARSRGATALVIRVPADSALLGDLDARQLGMFLRDPLPILLVAAEARLEADVQIEVPALTRKPSEVNRNVCGVLRGSDPKLADEAIVISAHLDHLGTRGTGEDNIYNGADDDASGCTGVVAMAEAFRALQTRPGRSVVFITFWGEESGLLGSRDFCTNPVWPLEKIVAGVNLEMLGRPEEGARYKAWMTGWLKSDLGELVARGAARGGIEVFRHRRYSPMLYGSSDNASFVRQGVIAHSFSAGSLHGDYHRNSDEWEKLDLEHMTVVIQGMFAGCLPLADGSLTPSKRGE